MGAERPASTPLRNRLAALTVALAVTVSVLDGVMLNATLPSIARQLGAVPADAIWVVNAYQLAGAVALLPLGKVADIYGHKRVYLACIALFGIASLGCALAPDLPTLGVFRFLQGCGGAGSIGITNAMLRYVYPPEKFGRGVANNALLVALSLAAGPSIASVIVELADWRWLFLINLPLVILLIAIGLPTLPPGGRDTHRFDWQSALLSMATFGMILLALDTAAHDAAAIVPALLAIGGFAAGALLLNRQKHVAQPLVPIDMLRTRRFGFSVACMFAASAAQLTAYVVLPFHFQLGLGRSQIETGLLFLPWPIALAVAAPLAGWLGERFDAGRQGGFGLTLFAAGLVMLALLSPGASFADIAWRMALCGFGYGLYQPANSRTLITSAPPDRLGSASVMGATARVMGQAAGAALAALLFRQLPDSGRTIALLSAAATAGVGIALSVSRGSQPLATRSTG